MNKIKKYEQNFKGLSKPQSNRLQSQQWLSDSFKTEKEFGGALLKNSHAKKSRAISTKNAMHVILRSSKAKGDRSFLSNHQRRVSIEKVIHKNAKKFGIKIYKLAIVSNHIHFLLRATYRRGFIAFLRAVSGIIPRLVLDRQRGCAGKHKFGNMDTQKIESNDAASTAKKRTGFWDQRPWSRIVTWMKDFAHVKNYVQQNFNEAMGFAAYKPRKIKLKSRRTMYFSTA